MFNTIALIGIGNVGQSLLSYFKSNAFNIKVYSQSEEKLKQIKKKYQIEVSNDFKSIKEQLIILSVRDDVIQKSIDQIPENLNIVHTSGAVNLEKLNYNGNLGVFYPLQTFTKNKYIPISEVPLYVESINKDFEIQLLNFAKTISNQVSIADSNYRKKLHVSAVWVNNFVNHILYQSQEFAQLNEVEWNDLIPLLNETIQKALQQGAYQSQTGPAIREDKQTIDEHLLLMNEEQKKLYLSLTESITNTYKK